MSRSSFGTVRQLKSKRFQARYTDPNGVRRVAGTFETKKAARTALAAIEVDIAREGVAWLPPGVDPEYDSQTLIKKYFQETGQKYPGKNPLFSTFAEEVLKLKSATLAPQTVRNYRTLLDRFLLPEFGNFPLSQVTVKRVDQWWAQMATETGKVNRRNAYFLLSSIMRYAVRYSYIPASPCVVEGAGKAVSAPRPYLTVDQFRAVVDAAPSNLRAPLWTMFGAHLRLGELCGLNVGDLDLEAKTLTVVRQSQEIKGGTVLRATKTGNHKTVTLLAPAVVALKAHMKGRHAAPDDPLFLGPKGGRLSRGYVRAQWLKATAAVGVPEAHIHDVRHTSLTLVAAHATTKEVMARGGHTSVAAAMKYQHATANRDAEVAAAVDAQLGNIKM